MIIPVDVVESYVQLHSTKFNFPPVQGRIVTDGGGAPPVANSWIDDLGNVFADDLGNTVVFEL